VLQGQHGKGCWCCCVFQEKPGLWNQINEGQEADDGTEHFVDVPDTDDEGAAAEETAPSGAGAGAPPERAHAGAARSGQGASSTAAASPQAAAARYDMRKRCKPLRAVVSVHNLPGDAIGGAHASFLPITGAGG
jgi:hypothetical protein